MLVTYSLLLYIPFCCVCTDLHRLAISRGFSIQLRTGQIIEITGCKFVAVGRSIVPVQRPRSSIMKIGLKTSLKTSRGLGGFMLKREVAKRTSSLAKKVRN